MTPVDSSLRSSSTSGRGSRRGSTSRFARTAERTVSGPGVTDETTMMNQELQPFDIAALYSALDDKRTRLGISWQMVANQLWELSSDLNDRRRDHPISPSTLKNMANNPRISCQHALFMLRWLGRSPESFLKGATGDDERFALPVVGPDRRLRWALKLLYASMDETRRQAGLTWRALAVILSCNPNQLTGLRTAKFATGMDLAMRIVQWMGRPAADFVYPASW
jgi:hypothetical protein